MSTTYAKPAPLLTVEEVAGVLKFHPVYIRRLFAKGKLSGVKLGRAVRFKAEHVEAFVNAGEIEAAGKEVAA